MEELKSSIIVMVSGITDIRTLELVHRFLKRILRE